MSTIDAPGLDDPSINTMIRDRVQRTMQSVRERGGDVGLGIARPPLVSSILPQPNHDPPVAAVSAVPWHPTAHEVSRHKRRERTAQLAESNARRVTHAVAPAPRIMGAKSLVEVIDHATFATPRRR